MSVILGLAKLEPMLGFATGVVSLPSLLRTALIIRHQPVGGPASMAEQLVLFGGSFLFVAVMGMAILVCCFVSCFGGVFAGTLVGQVFNPVPYGGLGVGIVAGFIVSTIVGCIAGYVALVRASLPFPHTELSRAERLVVVGVVFLSVVAVEAAVYFASFN